MKKILALITAMCLLLCGIQASARGERAVEVLRDLGIMKGDASGNLLPYSPLTRAELSTILTRVLFGEQYAENRFADTAGHWAADSINLMAEKNIVSGYGNGLFGPDDKVTLAQAVKILVNLLGYGNDSFNYPDDYILQAAKLAITKDVVKKPDEEINREEAAGLIMNSLYVNYADGSGTMADRLGKKTYFVSENGSDSNDGSYKNPWKTLEKAIEEVKGSTVVTIGRGTYTADKPLEFKNSGTSETEMLIFRAMPGESVNIEFDKAEGYALSITADFVSVEGMSFSQKKKSDEISAIVKGKGSALKNNVFENAGILLENAENISIEGNILKGGANAIKVDGGKGITVKNNELEAQKEASLIVLGNANGINIANNSFSPDAAMQRGSIVLGDGSTGVSKCMIWNNVIYAGERSASAGVILNGVTDLCFYNNIIDKTASCLDFSGDNKNLLVRNNIFMNSEKDAFTYGNMPKGFNSDYNCYYSAYPQIMENNSLFTNPYFVSEGDDWRLMNGSELAGSGSEIPKEFVCSDGSVILTDRSDFNGDLRGESWHMGIYATLSGEEMILADGGEEKEVYLSLDFRNGADHFVTSASGEWKVDGGAYWQLNSETGRTTSVYDGGLEWTDYEVSADVEASTSIEGNATGLIFRADKEMKNMYAIRFLSNNSLEFVKWQNDTFSSLQRYNYSFKPDTMYNLKVKIENNEFTFYVNGEKLGMVEDDTFKSGTVGFYCFREVNKYDNLKVVSID